MKKFCTASALPSVSASVDDLMILAVIVNFCKTKRLQVKHTLCIEYAKLVTMLLFLRVQ